MAKKFGLSGLIGYLNGIGFNIQHNEAAKSEDETFEVEEEMKPKILTTNEDEEEDKPIVPDPTMVSEEELVSLKTLAHNLAKNPKLLEAFQNGSLTKALETFPAAAELVQNAKKQQESDKAVLIAQIKTNGSNVYTDEELGTMSSPVLMKLNAQMNINYSGYGGAIFQNNAEEPLMLPSSLSLMAEEKTDE